MQWKPCSAMADEFPMRSSPLMKLLPLAGMCLILGYYRLHGVTSHSTLLH